MRISAIASCLEVPGLQVYLLRRQSTDLQKNHIEGPSGFPILLAPLVKADYAKIVYSPNCEISFKNGPAGGYEGGSKIFLLHCKDENSKYNFQGCEIHYLCVGRGTPVLMADGTYKAVEDVTPGDMAMTLRGPREVLRAFKAGVKPCVKVTTPYGEQIQPADHKVLTPGGWLSWDDLKVNRASFRGVVHVPSLQDGHMRDYEHPYTGKGLVSTLISNIEDCGISYCGNNDVFDLSVEGENHYITGCGLINKNCIDELTHFTETQYTFIRSRVRMAGLKIPAHVPERKYPRILLGANPGGIGHGFVKGMFIDDVAPMEIRQMPDEDGGLLRQYIPARLSDNPTLLMNDPKYAARLKGLGNDALVKAMLDGDWDVFQGQAFDFSRKHHVIPPVPVPAWAPITCCMDWGFGAPFAVCWFWTDADGRVYQFAEWYGWTGKPNHGLRLTDTEIALGILERERAMGLAGRDIDRLAGHDCFSKKPDYNGGGQGPSTAEIMSQHGIILRKADPNKVLKLRQFHERLRVPGDGTAPMYQVYDTCHQTLRTLPTLVMKENNPEVLEDHGAEDHLADAISQIFMARPMGFDESAPVKSLEHRLIEAFETSTVGSDVDQVAGFYGEELPVDPVSQLLDGGQAWNMDW